jgi:CRP-like cAMP-binding protein
LYGRGERPKAVLCVLAGEVRLVRPSVDGSEIILQRVRTGFVAEASLEVARYHCDIIAAADGILLHFPIAEFRAALAEDSAFQNAWSAQLAREVRKLRAQCERLSLKGAAERVLHYIETEGNEGSLILTQSRKAWAAELGLSHEALYRTLRDLVDKQVLLIDAGVITLRRHP